MAKDRMHLSRRRLLQGLTGAAVLATCAAWGRSLEWADHVAQGTTNTDALALMFAAKHGPTTEVCVRRAVALAISRPEILQRLAEHSGAVANDCGGHCDPELAQAILAESGYTCGFDLTLALQTESQIDRAVAEVLAAQLARVGIRATLALRNPLAAALDHDVAVVTVLREALRHRRPKTGADSDILELVLI